jgi:hypothetical protein
LQSKKKKKTQITCQWKWLSEEETLTGGHLIAWRECGRDSGVGSTNIPDQSDLGVPTTQTGSTENSGATSSHVAEQQNPIRSEKKI